MQSPAVPIAAVRCTAMPGMCVHDHNASGGSKQQHFAGVWLRGVAQHFLRELSPILRTGNDASCAIFSREIVQNPDGIADPESALVGQSSGIAVQRLRFNGVRIRGARIEAASI